MTEAHRNGHPPLPEGLLEQLSADPPPSACRHRIRMARQHARTRAYDDALVVREIASQLLLLSH